MGYKYVVFDLDGTIVDSHEGICKCFQNALKQYGVEEEIENIKALLGPPLSRTVITKYGFSEEDGAAIMKIHLKRMKAKGIYECHIYEQMVETLEYLKSKGIKIGIATNKQDEIVFAQLKHLDIEKYFDAIVANNMTQTRGTKSDFVRMSYEEMGANDKSEIVMVGDRFNDIAGGKDNDLDTIGVTYGYGSEKEIVDCKPTYIVSSPKEIIDIVLK